MNFKLVIISCLLAVMVSSLSVQQKYTISGSITDADTGEDLFGASVYVAETSNGTTSNIYGFYSLTHPDGTYVVTTTYIDFEDIVM